MTWITENTSNGTAKEVEVFKYEKNTQIADTACKKKHSLA